MHHPHPDRLVAGEPQGHLGSVGQLPFDGRRTAGQKPGEPADLLLDPAEVLGAQQCIGGVTPVTDGLGIVLQLRAHLVAAPAQVGQLSLQARTFLLGEILRSTVLAHVRQGTAPTRGAGIVAQVATRDHGDPGDAPTIPPPLGPIADPTRPSAAEEARTIAAATNIGTLASLTTAGDPWASFVTYGLLDGAPVLCVSHLAEHGRNLAADPRASLAVVAPESEDDPLASGRITLAGVVERPAGAELSAARDAHVAAVAAAKYYIDYSDFSVWVLRVHRVRWVGGYGRMDSATAADYAAAAPDPIRPHAAGAISHLNADHAGALAEMARVLGGYPDTDRAVCTGVDRYGLDLRVSTPRGDAYTRVGFGGALSSVDDLRSAAVDLVQRTRQSDPNPAAG